MLDLTPDILISFGLVGTVFAGILVKSPYGAPM